MKKSTTKTKNGIRSRPNGRELVSRRTKAQASSSKSSNQQGTAIIVYPQMTKARAMEVKKIRKCLGDTDLDVAVMSGRAFLAPWL